MILWGYSVRKTARNTWVVVYSNKRRGEYRSKREAIRAAHQLISADNDTEFKRLARLPKPKEQS